MFMLREGIAHGFGIGLGLFAAVLLCSACLAALASLVAHVE